MSSEVKAIGGSGGVRAFVGGHPAILNWQSYRRITVTIGPDLPPDEGVLMRQALIQSVGRTLPPARDAASGE